MKRQLVAKILAATSWSHPIVCFKEKFLSPVHQSSPPVQSTSPVIVYNYAYSWKRVPTFGPIEGAPAQDLGNPTIICFLLNAVAKIVVPKK